MEPEKIIETLKDRLESESLDAFEICYLGNDHLCVEARDGSVESFIRSQERGVAVRVIKENRMGWASSTDFSDKSINQLIKAVITSTQEVSPSEEAVIAAQNLKKNAKAKRTDTGARALTEKKGRPLREIPDHEKINVALALEREAKTLDPKITRVRQPLYEEIDRHVSIFNSQGVWQNASRAIASCEVRAIAEANGVSEGGYDFAFSPRFDDLDVAATARRAAQRALSLLGAASLKTGRYDVVFDSRAAANLVRLLAPSFFANNVQRRKSALVGKKGERLYQEMISIVDDGLLPDGFGSFLFDDEGVPRRKNFLVKKGVITDWLYDSARAAREGRASTGNCARSSIHQLPSINISNCYLCGGEHTYEDLIGLARGGFLVTDVMGLHTANLVTGDFSLGAEGFVIKDRVKGEPVRGVIVAGNVHELFKRVAAVGREVKFYASYGAPSILVPAMQVSGGR